MFFDVYFHLHIQMHLYDSLVRGFILYSYTGEERRLKPTADLIFPLHVWVCTRVWFWKRERDSKITLQHNKAYERWKMNPRQANNKILLEQDTHQIHVNELSTTLTTHLVAQRPMRPHYQTRYPGHLHPAHNQILHLLYSDKQFITYTEFFLAPIRMISEGSCDIRDIFKKNVLKFFR